MRWAIRGLLLFVLAAVTLPLVASAVEAVMSDPGNVILPAHLLLMSLAGAALASVTGRSSRSLLLGTVAGLVAAMLADLAWLLAIAG